MYKERKKDYIRPLDIATHMYKETKKEIVQDHCYMASLLCYYSCDHISLNTWCLLLLLLWPHLPKHLVPSVADAVPGLRQSSRDWSPRSHAPAGTCSICQKDGWHQEKSLNCRIGSSMLKLPDTRRTVQVVSLYPTSELDVIHVMTLAISFWLDGKLQ